MVQLLSFIAFTTSYYGFLMHTFLIVSTNTAKTNIHNNNMPENR